MDNIQLVSFWAYGAAFFLAAFALFMSFASCKIGIHSWSNWLERDFSSTASVKERICLKCGKLQRDEQ